MISPGFKYSDITEKIIGCAMKVHQTMRGGYQELIYHNCLSIELKKILLSYRAETELPIFYDGVEVGRRRVDFLVENKIVVEIKAVTELTDVHIAQTLNYLEALNLEVGLLINFGAKSLQFRRLVNNKVR